MSATVYLFCEFPECWVNELNRVPNPSDYRPNTFIYLPSGHSYQWYTNVNKDWRGKDPEFVPPKYRAMALLLT